MQSRDFSSLTSSFNISAPHLILSDTVTRTSFFFFSSSFVVLPGTKKPQLFSDQNVFHNKPSGAFTHRTGMSLCALLTVLLLISVKMEVFEVC